MQIADRLHSVPGVVANVYVLIDADGLTLVDAGLPYSHKRILAYVAQLGYPPAAVRRILITHADRDHMGGAAALRALTGARLYAGAQEGAAMAVARETRRVRVAPWLRWALRVLHALFVKVAPAAPDELLADGQELPILGGLRVIAAPGHTPGHLAFYAPAAGVLFAGHALRSLGGRLRVSSGANTIDEAQARASARQLLALNPRLVCTGHGPALQLAESNGGGLA